jgi:hypothetical protein
VEWQIRQSYARLIEVDFSGRAGGFDRLAAGSTMANAFSFMAAIATIQSAVMRPLAVISVPWQFPRQAICGRASMPSRRAATLAATSLIF